MVKVLVVDDDEAILDAVKLILEEEGFFVQTTSKGEETYRRIAEFKPDIILLDVLMSGYDGREICKNLKENPTTKNIPIVMISAHPSAKDSTLAIGANDFLAKPFEVDDLVQKLNQHLPL